MKQFHSIEKLDTGILYALELASSVSALLLAFGLIASMANVLTKGSVLTNDLMMQRIWAWTQCIAIEASVAGTIIRTFGYYAKGERIKTWLYGVLSALLLFTAAIVSNIESVQQTLNLTLDQAYLHVFIPVEALIWIRSIAIVLLIVAHVIRHVQREPEHPSPAIVSPLQSAPLTLSPDLVETLRTALVQATIVEEIQSAQPLSSAQDEHQANADEQRMSITQEVIARSDHEQATNESEHRANNGDRVKAYLAVHPHATDRALIHALMISTSTAN